MKRRRYSTPGVDPSASRRRMQIRRRQREKPPPFDPRQLALFVDPDPAKKSPAEARLKAKQND